LILPLLLLYRDGKGEGEEGILCVQLCGAEALGPRKDRR